MAPRTHFPTSTVSSSASASGRSTTHFCCCSGERVGRWPPHISFGSARANLPHRSVCSFGWAVYSAFRDIVATYNNMFAIGRVGGACLPYCARHLLSTCCSIIIGRRFLAPEAELRVGPACSSCWINRARGTLRRFRARWPVDFVLLGHRETPTKTVVAVHGVGIMHVLLSIVQDVAGVGVGMTADVVFIIASSTFSRPRQVNPHHARSMGAG